MNNDRKALKSGIWYTVANFLTKSIGILTIPIFTDLLSEAEYGAFGNYVAYLQVLTILITLNLESTFISAKKDFEKDFDSYASTMFLFSGLFSLIWWISLNVFSGFVVSKTHINIEYINCMCVYLFFLPAVNLYQAKERYRFGYKKSVLISCLIAVGTALVSVLLVLFMSDRLAGRIWGSALPTVLIGVILLLLLFRAGHNFKIEYIKYALPICLPFIPHLLSMTVLNALDKMMITDIRGDRENALYTLAYQCGTVVTILVTSLNTAFAPWLGEKLNDHAFSEVREFAKKYVLIFMYFTVGIMLISPDIMMIMGRKASYMEAQYVMPPVMLGCVCQFVYTMYVNVEQFTKHTVGMAIASVSAAGINYVLNYLLIPKHGYIAAAYTTLISFVWLVFAHIVLVYILGYSKTYPNKFILGMLGVAAAITVGVNFLYKVPICRYIIVAIYGCIFIFAIVKYKDQIINLFRKKASKTN